MSSYYLIRGSDPNGADRVEVTGEMIVGRSESCDLRVEDGHPSRRHARLTVEGDQIWLEDLGSANGTFVNDRPVTEKVALRPGDRVAFDLSMFVVAGPPAEDPNATVVRRPPVDPDATVMRPAPVQPAEPPPATAGPPPAEPAPAEPPAAEPSAAAKPAAPENARPAEPPAGSPPPREPAAEPPPAREPSRPAPPAASAPSRSEVPRSWADPDYQAAGTRVLSKEELRAMAAGVAPASGPSAAVEGPHVRVLNGHSAGSVLVLDADREEWSVGSDDDRDLRLTDEGVSAFHAKISHDQGRWRVIDQISANGTWVNDEKVTVSYLANGDRLRFAQVECEIQLPAGGRAGRSRAGKAKSASSSRPWLIAVVAAVLTAGVLALVTWFG